MLARALRGVTVGFYVDVGAWDPVSDSVTAYFYENGWCGVNIEPEPGYAQALRRARQRDITLEVAVGEVSGASELHVLEGTGLNTIDVETAKLFPPFDAARYLITVKMMTLTQIFDAYAPRDVHFLKVDCEGSEVGVFKGFDLARHRPWIILVEATVPNSQVPSHHGWEPMLLTSGYRFVYFDALNRFYLADEHAELAAAFAVPPNVFDGIVRAPEIALRKKCESELEEMRVLLAAAEQRAERSAEIAAWRGAEAAATQSEFRRLLASGEIRSNLGDSTERRFRSHLSSGSDVPSSEGLAGTQREVPAYVTELEARVVRLLDKLTRDAAIINNEIPEA